MNPSHASRTPARALRLTLAAAALSAAAVSLWVAAAGAAAPISVGDNYFVRSAGVPTVSAARGSKATFRWVGSRPHNAKGTGINLGANCGAVRSSGACTTLALTKVGTFKVYCSVHGAGDMSMNLRVR